jgi:hypothetical protein
MDDLSDVLDRIEAEYGTDVAERISATIDGDVDFAMDNDLYGKYV